MTAKTMLFASSALVVTVGLGGLAALGVVAKVPPGEYWPVVLGGGAVGLVWLALITTLHFRVAYQEKHGLLD